MGNPGEGGNEAYLQSNLMKRIILVITLVSTLSSYAGYKNPTGNFNKNFSTASIGDLVWIDNNHDGRQDSGEKGIKGISVLLLDDNGNTIGSTVTDADGRYAFSGLDTGPGGKLYEVLFKLPIGFRFSPKNAVNSDLQNNSDADEYTGKSGQFTLSPGQGKSDVDAGLISISVGTLPLHTLDLTVQLQESKVTLKWIAENEMETRIFVVQRSTDGVNFKDIASKPLTGPTNNHTLYSYTDDIQPLLSTSSIIYYRIKAEDNLLRYAYSNISTIRTGNSSVIRTWPNPFVDKISITFQGLVSGKTDVILSDKTGRAAWSGVFETKRGVNQLSVTGVEKLPPGLYVISINERSSSQRLAEKLMKQ